MPEQKTLDTVTTISSFLSEIEIYNEFVQDIFASLLTISAFVANSSGIQDGVSYKQGDLLMRINNYPFIDYAINARGELILTTQGIDADNYTVNDDNGQLEYTVTE